LTKGRTTTRKKVLPPDTPPRAVDARALREFERGLKLFYQEKYTEAQARFASVIEEYPAERDLVEKSRRFQTGCDRRLQSGTGHLRKPEDLYYGAVLRVNDQEFEEAIQLLQKAQKLAPQDDRVVYLLSSTHARKGDRERALTYLREAIQLKPINRTLAKNDPDFEEIREDRDFLDAVSEDEI